MVFSSITFLFLFLSVVLAVYYIVPWGMKNIILLAASIFFYSWGEPVYVVLLILSILLNYFCGLEIEACHKDARRAKNSLIFAVGVNVLILGFFKYYGFLLDILGGIVGRELSGRELPLPMGISYFTFQAISYVMDVYRGKARAQKNVLDFALYITMFPQLIAGPIIRYEDVAAQIRSRRISATKLGQGAMLFIIGLGKKVILANEAGAAFNNITAVPSGSLSVLGAWLGCIFYAFQIYFDFSGYSDMAIGLGKMFGFEFRKNFDYPYTSRSITEFWRRWHISLSQWFKEYVYIPLGGNRCSVSRNIANLLIVWGLTGMWHGASWNFIAWGLYYGVVLILEKYVWGEALEKLPSLVKRVYTLVLVLIGWVFFFSPTLGQSFGYLGAMFGAGAGFGDDRAIFFLYTNWLILLLCVVASSKLGAWILDAVSNAPRGVQGKTVVAAVVYFGIFLVSVAFLVSGTFNPFLYFRF